MLLLITSHTLETADVPQGPLRAKYKNHSWENGAVGVEIKMEINRIAPD